MINSFDEYYFNDNKNDKAYENNFRKAMKNVMVT